MTDPDAINGAVREPVLVEAKGQLPQSGRPFVLRVPPDITDAEMVELLAVIAGGIYPNIKAQRRPASRLVLPQ